MKRVRLSGFEYLLIAAVAIAPGHLCAQASSPSGSSKGGYVGGSLGVYFEKAEGGRGEAVAGSVILGYRFGPRWGIQGEFGRTGNVYCRDIVNTPVGVGPYRYCHSDAIFTIDAVRRLTVGSLRPYIALGVGYGLHLGTGVEIPIGGRFTLAPGVDANVLPEMISVRPKVALLLLRF